MPHVVVSEKIPNNQQAISGIAGWLGKRRKPIRWAVDPARRTRVAAADDPV
ncbi:hypothetical protein [Micromonospora sp. PLK6-60]|uniref:hypothetical protein n=1 Tax=Micromonospora sp. PLK6-60 TaxID=2873383 RepID=UPI002107B14D|nr:hypothetical protein [Micromonospora sp. PLK6-60]